MNTNYFFSLTLTIIPYFLPACLARGPHHPRGEVVVKRHVHYTPEKKVEKITQDTNLLHDKEHLKEHLDEVAPKVDLSKMTDAEIELYYFLLHDTDKNSKLDGLELLNAILHTTHGDEHDHVLNDDDVEESSWNNDAQSQTDAGEENFNNFVELVDQVLKEDDKNQDGYLDYAEYVEGRKKAERVVDIRPSIRVT